MTRQTRKYTSTVALLALLAALVALPAAAARAETFGGLGQVGPTAEPPEEGGANHLDAGGPIGFVADPVHGGFYTADTWVKAGKRHLRVQAFNAVGQFQRETPGGLEVAAEDAVGGLAIDPTGKQLYVLLTAQRPDDSEARNHVKTDEAKRGEEKEALKAANGKEPETKEIEGRIKELETQIASEKAKFVFDGGQPAAAALYAYAANTLEPAAGAGAGGLLTGEAALQPRAKEAAHDFALLHPHGIAVAPEGDVVVVGQEDVAKSDEEPPSLRAAVQRIHTAAAESLGPRYVDKNNCFDGGVPGDLHCAGETGEPSSPVVLRDGELLVERGHALWDMKDAENSNESFASVQAAKTYESEPKWIYALPGSNLSLPAEPTATGNQVQLVETGEHSGRIYATARTKGKSAVLVVLGYAEGPPNVTLTELGWTGGASGRCTVPAQAGVLAAGSGASPEGEGFILSVPSAASLAITRFGPGGEACGHATLEAIGVIVEEGAPLPVSEDELAVVEARKVTFSSTIGVADALFGTWSFQNLDGRKQPAPATLGFSEGPLAATHSFGPEEGGRYLVTLEVHPDDFEPPLTRQLYVVVGMRVAFKSLRGANVGQAVPFHVKVVDPYEPSAPEFTYKWRFGDGTTLETRSSSSEPSFEHVFSRAGTYEPFLEVVDRGGHRAAAISTGVTVTAGGSSPPPGSSGSKPTGTVNPVFSARLSSVSIRVRNGKLFLKLSCTATSGFCKGRVVLKTVKAFSSGKGKHKRKKPLTLAHANFDIPAGHVATVLLHLTHRGRSLLARKHTLQAIGLITTDQSSGQPITTATALTLKLARRR